jgi:hypothetical protein
MTWLDGFSGHCLIAAGVIGLFLLAPIVGIVGATLLGQGMVRETKKYDDN